DHRCLTGKARHSRRASPREEHEVYHLFRWALGLAVRSGTEASIRAAVWFRPAPLRTAKPRAFRLTSGLQNVAPALHLMLRRALRDGFSAGDRVLCEKPSPCPSSYTGVRCRRPP